MIKRIIKKVFPFLSYEEKIYKLYVKAHKFHEINNTFNKHIVNYYNFKMYKKYNCIISGHAEIKSRLILPHPIGIVVGGTFGDNTTEIGNDVTIYQNVTIGQKNNLYPKIGNNVTIFAGAVIAGNVVVGDNVIIGANSVVLNDIPDSCVVAGVPAKIIKRNDKNEES